MSYGGYNNNQGYGQVDSHEDRNHGRYNNFSTGTYGDGPNDVEMQAYGQPAGSNINAMLDEIREVDRAIDDIDGQIDLLERTFKQVLVRPDMPSNEIASLTSKISTSERTLVNRMKKIKSTPGADSPRIKGQLDRVERRLRATHGRYNNAEKRFRQDSQAAAERQYRIVRPDATEDEVHQALENPDAPIFQQALLNSDRRGQAQSTLRNVRERHEAIQNIERQMRELATLFEELAETVAQQGEMVNNIEQKGEEVHDNVVKANTEIGGAIEKARARNRKKWWCVLIVILIIIVIIIVALVAYFVTKK